MQVSILIATRDRLDLTRACLESLWHSVPRTLAHEVLVYDDQSTDGTTDYLRSLKGAIRLFTGERRGCFAANNNRLADEARGRWLVMLNNDTLLEPGWLEPMLRLAEREDAGVVGNLQVFPDRDRVNHAGVVFDQERIPRHLYEGMPADLPAATRERPLQAVTAACWLTSAELFRSHNGFDTGYVNGFEDLDYCFRLRDEGHSIWYTGESVIGHHGSSTPGRFAADQANAKRFFGRWRDRIEPDLDRLTRHDGVPWPRRSVAYKAVRALWRNPRIRACLLPVLSTPTGVRARQAALQRLCAASGRRAGSSEKRMADDFLTVEGHCPTCRHDTTFRSRYDWLRDHFLCERCGSIPRERALMRVLDEMFPNWPQMRIHESSPGPRGASVRLRAECADYVASQCDPSVPFGQKHPNRGYRSEDLENQTFPDESFDLVITQDVMEHVFDPAAAFREIARTLRPGGAHVFTTPLVNKDRPSERCARLLPDGSIEHLREPEYYGEPVDAPGSLVTMRWGYDIADHIHQACGLPTTLVHYDDLRHGIRAEYIEVCVMRKPAARASVTVPPRDEEPEEPAQEASSEPRLPDFLILGGARCGTTLLHGLLLQHPEVAMSQVKEPKFFHLVDAELDLDRLSPVDQAKWGGAVPSIAPYLACFGDTAGARAVGEASPIYLGSELAPKAIARIVPGARLVACLRDPVERAMSHFRHNRGLGLEPIEDFEEAFRRDMTLGIHSEYYRLGLYGQHIRSYLDYFPLDQLHVIEYGEMERDPASVFAGLCRFLGVDDAFRPSVDARPLATRKPLERLAKDAPAWIVDCFRDDARDLERTLGRAFPEWVTA